MFNKALIVSKIYKFHNNKKLNSDRNLPVPSCGNDEEYIRCRSGNLCCYNAPRGCRVCFCTSHDYDNS